MIHLILGPIERFQEEYSIIGPFVNSRLEIRFPGVENSLRASAFWSCPRLLPEIVDLDVAIQAVAWRKVPWHK